jgi:protein SCO1/2
MKFLVGALIALVGCVSKEEELPFFRTAAMSPEWLSSADADAPSMHRVAAFNAIDQAGSVITQTSLAGHVTIAHFFFTSCGDVCPTTTRNLQGMLRALPANAQIQILSYSVRPLRDSIAELRRFAAKHHITDPRWHFLTGDQNEIETLARDSYFVRLGKDSTYGVSSIAHTESLVLVDDRGRLRGVYAGSLPLEVDRLREDIATLLRERESG